MVLRENSKSEVVLRIFSDFGCKSGTFFVDPGGFPYVVQNRVIFIKKRDTYLFTSFSHSFHSFVHSVIPNQIPHSSIFILSFPLSLADAQSIVHSSPSRNIIPLRKIISLVLLIAEGGIEKRWKEFLNVVKKGREVGPFLVPPFIFNPSFHFTLSLLSVVLSFHFIQYFI